MVVKNAKAQIIDGASVPVVSGDVKPASLVSNTSAAPENLNEMLKKLINQSPIMLFMKGNAENPQCGNNLIHKKFLFTYSIICCYL